MGDQRLGSSNRSGHPRHARHRRGAPPRTLPELRGGSEDAHQAQSGAASFG